MTSHDPTASDTQLWLLRHAPARHGGRLAGRRDVDADLSDTAGLARLRAALPDAARIWASPAKRCRQTAAALGLEPECHDALWEQNFGAWEGVAFADLHDLGPRSNAALARHRPPGGESFDDMAVRVCTQLAQARGTTVVIAHAGTVRAALSMLIGAAALSFAVAPASICITRRRGGSWSVDAVNRLP